MPASAGSPNGEDTLSTTLITIPEELINENTSDKKIKTFILKQKKQLLLTGKFVAAGYEISGNELILRWKPGTINSIANPIIIEDSEEEPLKSSGKTSPGGQSEVCIDNTRHILLEYTVSRDHSRRVVAKNNAVYTVSMFGDLQTVDLKRSTTEVLKVGTKGTNIQDALLIDTSVVCASNHGISIYDVSKGDEVNFPTKLKLTCLAHLKGPGREDLTLIAGTENGLGHFRIYNDKLKYRKIDNIKTRISAVALQREETVVSSSGRKLRVFDMTESKTVVEGIMSSPVCQLKIDSDSPQLLAMEVSHLDRQIHLFDLRTPLFTKPPVLEMGYRISDIKKSKYSKFVKGDMHQNLYVRGYEDGTINLFDIRRPDEIVTTQLTNRKSPITHCTLQNASAYGVGKNTLSCVDFSLS